MFTIPDHLVQPLFRGFDKYARYTYVVSTQLCRDGNRAVDYKEFVAAVSVFCKGSFEEKLKSKCVRCKPFCSLCQDLSTMCS